MLQNQARPVSPLQRVQHLRPKDGPPLPVGQQLRGLLQLQVLHAVPPVRVRVLHHGGQRNRHLPLSQRPTPPQVAAGERGHTQRRIARTRRARPIRLPIFAILVR